MSCLELVTRPLTSWIGSDMPQEELFNITCTARRGYRCVEILYIGNGIQYLLEVLTWEVFRYSIWLKAKSRHNGNEPLKEMLHNSSLRCIVSIIYAYLNALHY